MSKTTHQKARQNVEELVARLRKASEAYYETSSPKFTDAEYDMLLEELQEIAPNHPFLKEVGWTPKDSVVKLPVPMPSLDKRKPDTLRAEDIGGGSHIVADKLDGISALWVSGYSRKPALYLRGNGLEGQDVSHCIGGIQGLVQCSGPFVMVRGELIMPKGAVEGTLARNWVNGVLHQKTPSKEDLAKIRFVAYQVCEPRTLTRFEQMDWLLNRGFEVVWHTQEAQLSREILEYMFEKRRKESPYECDGLVVGRNTVPLLEAGNPKDAYAFKMPVDDQRAESTVLDVEWASSRTGNWIPRIRFEPVKIGTATIEYCTGFHASFIRDNAVSPGAKILVRRSGDVIPTLEKVLVAGPTGWKQPPEGRWKWDTNGVHAVDTSEEASPEKLALEMAHQLVALGIEGVSKTTCKKIVEGGIRTLYDLMVASVNRVQELIGKVNGEKLKTSLEPAMKNAPLAAWIKSFLGWPKGFGDKRIEACLALEPDVSKWANCGGKVPKGMSAEAFAEVVKQVPAYLAWRERFPPSKVVAAGIDITPVPTIQLTNGNVLVPTIKGYYVMSGFRDADLQKRLLVAGWRMDDKVKRTTQFLLVPDDAKETVKVKTARDAGVRIVLRSAVDSLL
jgi:NAD-dependent DNA ligase